MKTSLKVVLGVVAALVAIRIFPVLLLPIVLGVIVTLACGSVLAGGLAALLAATLSLLAALLAVGLVALAVLSPLWIPALAIVGIVSLCRRSRPPVISPA
ncbi:MAG: hypothetical protein JWM35_642 [Verrucomicrobia bacterium]|nr:hypothetical protein [Verrucomicrobiota bacterium]